MILTTLLNLTLFDNPNFPKDALQYLAPLGCQPELLFLKLQQRAHTVPSQTTGNHLNMSIVCTCMINRVCLHTLQEHIICRHRQLPSHLTHPEHPREVLTELWLSDQKMSIFQHRNVGVIYIFLTQKAAFVFDHLRAVCYWAFLQGMLAEWLLYKSEVRLALLCFLKLF